MLCVTATHSQEEAAGESAPVQEQADSAIDQFFAALVHEAQQVYSLLNEVTDKESADRIAPLLDKSLAHMAAKMQELEQFPFRDEQDSEALTVHMASLTQVAQSCQDAMKRLSEVHAYGSDSLMSMFSRYKLQDNSLGYLREDDLPHSQLYGEMADSLDDALYSLRRVQDEASAREAVSTLQALLDKLEQAHRMLVQLAPPRTEEQREAVRPIRERLRQLSTLLKQQNDRLQAARCYQSPELDSILPRLLQLAAS